MKKHNYRTKKVNDINWPQLRQELAGQALVFCGRLSQRTAVRLAIEHRDERIGINTVEPLRADR